MLPVKPRANSNFVENHKQRMPFLWSNGAKFVECGVNRNTITKEYGGMKAPPGQDTTIWEHLFMHTHTLVASL